jgi:antitoxin component YwqK of YwqJK toxin-antitoxin module
MCKGLSCLAILIPLAAFGETTSKVTARHTHGGPKKMVYYDGGKQVATRVFDNQGRILEKTGKIPDGIVKGYFGNGKLESEGRFKDGKSEGIVKWYYENGNLKVETTFAQDKWHGVTRWYFDNGILEATGNYKNGAWHGVFKRFHENGKLALEQNFKHGTRKGKFMGYHDNGNLSREGEYIGGTLNGTYREYNGEGKLVWQGVFNDGKQVDPSELEKERRLPTVLNVRPPADADTSASGTREAR